MSRGMFGESRSRPMTGDSESRFRSGAKICSCKQFSNNLLDAITKAHQRLTSLDGLFLSSDRGNPKRAVFLGLVIFAGIQCGPKDNSCNKAFTLISPRCEASQDFQTRQIRHFPLIATLASRNEKPNRRDKRTNHSLLLKSRSDS
jgi:hypothetical protein